MTSPFFRCSISTWIPSMKRHPCIISPSARSFATPATTYHDDRPWSTDGGRLLIDNTASRNAPSPLRPMTPWLCIFASREFVSCLVAFDQSSPAVVCCVRVQAWMGVLRLDAVTSRLRGRLELSGYSAVLAVGQADVELALL